MVIHASSLDFDNLRWRIFLHPSHPCRALIYPDCMLSWSYYLVSTTLFRFIPKYFELKAEELENWERQLKRLHGALASLVTSDQGNQ